MEGLSSRRDTASHVSSAKSFSVRNLIRRDSARTETQTEASAPRGPIGLTTLHVPTESVASDLVFVHGLNGDSQNTWSRNADPALFWPREWLPYDEAFRDVRIHSFGYSSAIFRESTVLNIADFARSLLGAIQDARTIPQQETAPLVFVGHSMGGLVIKKAYILGRQIAEFQSLTERIRGIFFLATPHQGADIAVTLSRILALVPGVKNTASPSFVNDLFPQSPILQSINDEFPRLCDDARSLQLFSFFETRPMNYGLGKGLIVDKHAAVMNYSRERRTYLDANHRDVARFSSPEDPSYVTVRNALATFIDAQRRSTARAREEVGIDQRAVLNKFLGYPEIPEDDLMMQESRRLRGTGEWLFQKDCFKEWKDGGSSLLWLRGRPGAGKSFLAGNAVNYFRERGNDCCSFFFTGGDTNKATINAFLRSMAFQMAMLHPEIHATVAQIANKKGTTVDKVDHNPVWRQLYLSSGILKVKLARQQYWVIDAMDECKNSSEIMSFLLKAQELWPVCILVTSRDPHEAFVTHRTEILTATISEDDSNKDIQLFLQMHLDFLPSPTQEGRQRMANQILERSRGCFLWANLMLKELRQVHTAAETKMVLASNPSDMDHLYLRILDDMSRARFGKDLAKAILAWTTCSIRPLTKGELHAAIQLDIKDMIDNIERSVVSCCGNLVYVDSRDRFQLIHSTAREFLLSSALDSEFAVDRAGSHTRIALACLQCLAGNERKVGPRMRSSSGSQVTKSPLVSYASEHLFQHLHHVKSTNDEVLLQLAKFFASPSLMTWIEYIAAHSDLQKVYQAGKTVLNLLSRRAHHTPNLGSLRKDLPKLETWGNDLMRLVTKFSHRMRHSPSAIRQLIPPFCPPESIIRKQFCLPNRGLSVHGSTGTSWDDCLTTIGYAKGTRPLCSAAGIGYFALGMSTGKIRVFDDTIFQEVHVFDHQEPVWLLSFGETGQYLATSSSKSVRIWDLESWKEVQKFPIKSLPLVLSFLDRDVNLLVATKKNELLFFDLETGDLREEPVDWTRDLAESGDGPALHVRQPTLADYSPHQNLLAVIYRGEDILLWDTEQYRIHDLYEKETGSRQNGSLKLADGATTVKALAFSAAEDTFLLATTYSDGDLIIYNTYTGSVENSLPGGNLLTLASSPDGRTLAGADTRGNILLFDFETMKYLYRISIANNTIMAKFISFTTDGQRVIDTRSAQCRVWHPTILHRQDLDDENSDTVSISTGPKEVDYQVLDYVIITAIWCVKTPSQGPPAVFCGKEDGSVHAYDIAGAEPTSEQLFLQSVGSAIDEIHFDEATGLLSCIDRSSQVTSRMVRRQPRAPWHVEEPLLNEYLGVKVTQILGSGAGARLLVSSEEHDTLWPLDEKPRSTSVTRREGGCRKKRWLCHPNKPECLIRVAETAVELRSWATLECIVTIPFPDLGNSFNTIDCVVSLHNPQHFATVAVDPSETKPSRTRIHVWDFKHFDGNQTPFLPTYSLENLSSSVELIIGVFGDRLVYLDGNYWVNSLSITEPLEIPVRHFFIPNDWLSLVNHLMMDVGRGGEILFMKQSDLAVIRRGLEVTENGTPFNPRRKSTVAMRPGPTPLPGRQLETV